MEARSGFEEGIRKEKRTKLINGVICCEQNFPTVFWLLFLPSRARDEAYFLAFAISVAAFLEFAAFAAMLTGVIIAFIRLESKWLFLVWFISSVIRSLKRSVGLIKNPTIWISFKSASKLISRPSLLVPLVPCAYFLEMNSFFSVLVSHYWCFKVNDLKSTGSIEDRQANAKALAKAAKEKEVEKEVAFKKEKVEAWLKDNPISKDEGNFIRFYAFANQFTYFFLQITKIIFLFFATISKFA